MHVSQAVKENSHGQRIYMRGASRHRGRHVEEVAWITGGLGNKESPVARAALSQLPSRLHREHTPVRGRARGIPIGMGGIASRSDRQ